MIMESALKKEYKLSNPNMDTAVADDRLARNLAAFERYAPHLHARLSNLYELATTLTVTETGAIDITFGGGSLYRGDACAHTRAELDNFVSTPERVSVSMRRADELAGIAGVFARWSATYPETSSSSYSEHRTGTNSHFAFVFGVGLAMQLQPIADLTGCRDMVLVEPNIEHIYHSLYVTDWHEVFEAMHVAGGGVHFIVEREVDGISSRIRDIVRECGTAFLDGTYVHQHYKTGLLNRARKSFHEDFPLHLYGLGFYEDELVMMSNAVSNLGQGKTKVISSALPVRDTPVFICGSGPSIDKDMAFILGNREKVILVSLGSALRALRAEGIEPDYHVELENEEVNTANVRRAIEEFGPLKKTTLIGSTSVRPETSALFPEVAYFFRDRVSPTIVFRASADPLGACGPSVANAGLISLLYMGFRKFYLFGVDMGTRNRDVYHSAATYIGIGAAEEWSSSNRFAVPANFGGTAYTEGILNWSRFTFENVVRLHRDIECFNCSDGVRIEHVTPQLSRRVTLPPGELDRAAVKDKIYDKLLGYDGEHCRSLWRRAEIEEHANTIFDRVFKILESAKSAPKNDLGWARELYELVVLADADEPPTRTFLFGTTVLILSSFFWAEGRIRDGDEHAAYRDAALVEMKSAYLRMQARYTRLLDDVDGYFAGELDEVHVIQGEAA